MKILSIGLDKNIFIKDSPNQIRQIEYGTLFEEIHIIIFSLKKFNFTPQKISSNVWIYPTNSINRFFYLFDGYKIAKSLIKDRKISIITTQDPFETGFLGWILKKKFKIPLLIQVHTEFPFKYFALESPLNFFRWFLALFLIPKADRVRVVSMKIKDYIGKRLSYPPEKIDVLPILVDIEKLNQKEGIDIKRKYPGFRFYFLTVSRLVKCKNIPLQLKALSKFKLKYKDFLLVIVGDGPERKKLEKLALKLNLKDNVIFEGWQRNIASYFKSADCLLFSSNYEGYGMVIIEALSFGLPVIATKVGVATQAIENGKNGFLIEIGSEKEYVEALEKIVKNSLKSGASLLFKKLPTKEEYLKQYREMFYKILNNQK